MHNLHYFDVDIADAALILWLIETRENAMNDYDAAVALSTAVHEHRNLIQNVGYELAEISDACSVVGMERVAKSLSTIIAALDKSVDTVMHAHSEAIYANVANAEQATTNMMRGILAGIDIGAKQSV